MTAVRSPRCLVVALVIAAASFASTPAVARSTPCPPGATDDVGIPCDEHAWHPGGDHPDSARLSQPVVLSRHEDEAWYRSGWPLVGTAMAAALVVGSISVRSRKRTSDA